LGWGERKRFFAIRRRVACVGGGAFGVLGCCSSSEGKRKGDGERLEWKRRGGKNN
jgi:hypothetical protein